MRASAMVALSGPLAMINYEPRQARKGATVVVTSCAGVWLVRAATQILFAVKILFLLLFRTVCLYQLA